MFAHRQLLAADAVALVEPRLLHDTQPGELKVVQADLRQALDHLLGDEHPTHSKSRSTPQASR